MVGSSLPSLVIQTTLTCSANEAHSPTISSVDLNHFQSASSLATADDFNVKALLACTSEGHIVSPFARHSQCNDPELYEDECSPVEEGSSQTGCRPQDTGTPTVTPESEISTSAGLPLTADSRLSTSVPSLIPLDPGLDVSRASTKSSCRCPYVEAHGITKAVKHSALAHLRDYTCAGPITHGRQRATAPRWMHKLIEANLDQAYESCVSEIRKTAKIARPDNWPIHDSKFPSEQYLGHVQPWMRATAQRHACTAAYAAFLHIGTWQGLNGSAHHQFSFNAPGVLDPSWLHYPCQCKESHARNIASGILEDTMIRLGLFVSTLASCSPKKDRVAMHSQVWSEMKSRIQTAMLKGLEEAIEVGDVRHLCSRHEMTHVRPWMSRVVKQRCLLVAKAEPKKLRWRTREIHINWFQGWLETLYQQDAEDEDVMMADGDSSRACGRRLSACGDMGELESGLSTRRLAY